jgi:S-adenosylmethionine hydrolase
MRFIHLVADYGVGDSAFGEVIQKLKSLDPKLDIYPTSVPAFSTLATGFRIAQYSCYNNTFPGLAIYSNTAPRKDKQNIRKHNAGEKFMYALLDNSVPILAVNSGYCFSFVKKHIKNIYDVNVSNKGSQFRSRDFYPEAVVGILNKDDKYIGKEHNKSKIPNVPKDTVVHVDGYGNIKTTVRMSECDLQDGDRIKLKINNKQENAFFANGIFEVKEGDLVFAPGSSGGKDPFMEVSLRGSSASTLFNNPQVEQKVLIS